MIGILLLLLAGPIVRPPQVPTAQLPLYTAPGAGSVPRTFASRLGDEISVCDKIGAPCPSGGDDTAAIQTALNSGAKNIYVPDGAYTISARLVQAPGTTVLFGGGAYLQPNAATWSDAYVYQIYDNWNVPTGDYINGQYLRGNRTAVYGLRIFPSAPISATCLLGSDGLGIVVQDLRTWGCKNGGIELQHGNEWRINGAQLIAPLERTATSKAFNTAAADGLIDGLVGEAYPYCAYFQSTSSNNDVFNAHCWGQPAINDNPAWTALTAYTTNMYVKNSGNTYRCITAGTSASSGGPATTAADITDGTVHWTYVQAGTGQGTRAMNWAFWFDGGGTNAGGSNRCWGCIADGPERINPANPASTANGGIGFYIENWQNSVAGGYVIGTANLSKAFVINNAQGNSIIGSNAPFDATKFETGGYVVFQGTATASNNTVFGGSFNRDSQLKTGPSWTDPTTGYTYFGAAAVSPGTDANVGGLISTIGTIGLTTASAASLTLNRTGTTGDQIIFNKDGTTYGRIGAAGTGAIAITFASGGPIVLAGTGDPEGIVTASIGSLFIRTDGWSSGSVYVKQNGAGNTGWSQIPGARRKTPTYGTTVVIDASIGNEFVITPTDGVAFTINSPINSQPGLRLTIRIKNTFGVLGALTFGATYKASAWTQPANGFSRSVDFQYDGTNWIEVSRTPADVPN